MQQITMLTLHNLRRQQYSAERMCLAVLGGHSLDTLQQWVGAAFAGVSAGRGPRPQFAAAGPPFEVLPAATTKHKTCVSVGTAADTALAVKGEVTVLAAACLPASRALRCQRCSIDDDTVRRFLHRVGECTRCRRSRTPTA